MKYGKYLIAVLLITFGSIQTSFWHFEDKMYCDITKEKIVISLDNKQFYTCKVYVRYIESKMKNVYKDMLTIQKYIDKQEDLWYWKPLKDEKVVLFNLLQNMRLNILAHMKTFETNLFETSKKYFLDSIVTYKRRLIRSVEALRTLQDSSWEKYLSLLEQQLSVIEAITQSKTFETLNENIERYVYLKQQLPWK